MLKEAGVMLLLERVEVPFASLPANVHAPNLQDEALYKQGCP